MKAYRAEGSFRHQHPVLVYVDGELSGTLRHHVQHSPDGYAWGYGGSGPSELAKDILWDVLEHEPAPALYHKFRDDVIARLDQKLGFYIEESYVLEWIRTWKGLEDALRNINERR